MIFNRVQWKAVWIVCVPLSLAFWLLPLSDDARWGFLVGWIGATLWAALMTGLDGPASPSSGEGEGEPNDG